MQGGVQDIEGELSKWSQGDPTAARPRAAWSMSRRSALPEAERWGLEPCRLPARDLTPMSFQLLLWCPPTRVSGPTSVILLRQVPLLGL